MTPREIRRLKYASRGISRLGVTRFGKDQPNAGGSGSNLDPGLTFAVDFNQSTTPSSGPPAPFTFTRATTATITDFEGLIKSCLSGELRIQGARRVANLLTKTEALNHTNWVKYTVGPSPATPIVTDAYATAPDGTTTASRLQANRGTTAADGAISMIYQTPFTSTTASAAHSVWLKSNTGASQTVTIKSGAAGSTGGALVTVTTSWQRFSYAASTTAANIQYEIGSYASNLTNGGGTQALDILVWHPQSENTTGQSNQNPSEYVSNGVLSSPFHGYFADGVKYFAYQNGNTVASNVVTEAQGAAIAGTMGYLAEGQRTNLCLQSETFGTTWLPAAATISSNQITAPSGTTTADQLVAGGTFGLPRVGQITAGAANTTNTFSVYAKAGTKNWLLLYQQSVTTGTDSVRGWFNLNTGVVGSVSNQGTGSGATISITALNDGWYRCTLVGKPSTGASSVRMVVAMANADGGIDYATDVADNLYIWGAQEEDGVSFASTYIPTTTAAVTRNADVLTCPSAGIVSSNCTVTLEVAALPPAFATNGRLIEIASDEPNRQGVYVQPSGIPLVYSNVSGINTATVTGTTDLRGDTLAKIGVVMASNDVRLCVNGAMEGTPDTSCDMPATTTIYFGAYMGGTGFEPYCCFVSVRIYKNKLSDAQLQALTS